MSKEIYVHDIREGYVVESDIMSEGRVLVKTGTILTSALAGRIRNWFKNSTARVTVSEDSCITAESKSVNMSNCVDSELSHKTIDGIKSLYGTKPENFMKVLTPVRECMTQVVAEIKLATDLCYELDEYRENDANNMEEHLFRVARLAIALANVYNSTVPAYDEIKLVPIGMASLLHDYGKTFKDRPAELKRLRVDSGLLKKLNLNPYLLTKPFAMEYHSVYAYAALRDKASESGREMLLLSGLPNYTIEKYGRNSPEVRGAQIIALCHVYDELLELVIRNNMTLPLENVLAVISQSAHNGDLSKTAYELFMDNILIYAPGTKVILSTGEYATVVGNNPQFPMRPMVFTDNSMGIPRLLDLAHEITITITQVLSNRDTAHGKVSQLVRTQLGKIVTD